MDLLVLRLFKTAFLQSKDSAPKIRNFRANHQKNFPKKSKKNTQSPFGASKSSKRLQKGRRTGSFSQCFRSVALAAHFFVTALSFSEASLSALPSPLSPLRSSLSALHYRRFHIFYRWKWCVFGFLCVPLQVILQNQQILNEKV
ncbi:MAG: hypothetical protein ACI4AM_08555 [Muribaculaceae bacterium]